LREINTKRREQATANRLENDKVLENVVSNIIKKSPSLAALFKIGGRLSDPFRATTAAPSRLDFVPKHPPTFFRVNPSSEKRPAHLGQRFRVEIETDAENQYFDRLIDGGSWVLQLNDREVDNARFNLMNGVGTLSVPLPANAEVGEILSYELTITDESRLAPFELRFERIVAAEQATTGGQGGTRKPPAVPGPGDREQPKEIGLPPIISVKENDENWEQLGFDRESVLSILGDDYFVNVDNVHLRHEMKLRPTQATLLEAQFKYGSFLLALALQKAGENRAENDETEDIESEVARVTRAFGPFIIPMISGLSELTEDSFAPAED
jgi:hypothetical protein